jgi:hypothetical protein
MFEALTGGGASVGFANSFVGGAFHALGTDTLVDQPTPFVAGESGPERVSVSPLYSGGGSSSSAAASGGGGTTANVNLSVTLNHMGSGSVDVNAIGQALLQMIRGQGQLQFVRAG